MGGGQEIEEEEDKSVDEFVGMPNSETSIRKVTVLMGRGDAIEEEEDLPVSASSTTQQVPPPTTLLVPPTDDADHATNGT